VTLPFDHNLNHNPNLPLKASERTTDASNDIPGFNQRKKPMIEVEWALFNQDNEFYSFSLFLFAKGKHS
jgi:hypothetical protein